MTTAYSYAREKKISWKYWSVFRLSVAKPNQIITMINQERASHVYRQDPMRTQNSRKRLKRRKTRMPLSWGIIVLVFDWLRRWHAFSSVVRRPYVKAAQSRGFTFTQLKVAVSLFSKIPWIDFWSISSAQEGLRVNFLLSPLASFQLELKDSSILR